MKNAGIQEKERKQAKGMNYSVDIPFHHPQPSGFWDINKERIREAGEKRDLSNALMEQLEGKRRLEVEIEDKKKDFKKQKLRKENPELDLVNEHKTIEDEFQVTARKR
jgi:pre-mRNA-splicing factor CDC5/CEF1